MQAADKAQERSGIVPNGLPPPKEKGGILSENKRARMMFNAYRPEYCQVVAEMVLNGALERDIVVALQTTRAVFQLWQAYYPEFAAALMLSKESSMANARVKRSMYEMANGYEQTQTKIVMVEGVPERMTYTESVPRNYNAAKFWLLNRDPDAWKRGMEHDPNSVTPAGVINIGEIRGMDEKQLESTLQVLKNTLTPSQQLRRLDAVTIEPEDEPDKEKQ